MTAQSKPTYTQIKDKFEKARETAIEAAHESLPAVLYSKRGIAVVKSTVSLEGLSFKSQREIKKWESSGTRRVAWNWEEVQRKYKAHPKRFELTIWHKDIVLCGACIGKPTQSGGKLRLDYIEASPMGTPLDGLVTDITLAAALIYARAIGAAQIRVMKPVNADVRDHYLSKQGFTYNEAGNFCSRDLI